MSNTVRTVEYNNKEYTYIISEPDEDGFVMAHCGALGGFRIILEKNVDKFVKNLPTIIHNEIIK